MSGVLALDLLRLAVLVLALVLELVVKSVEIDTIVISKSTHWTHWVGRRTIILLNKCGGSDDALSLSQ